MQLGNPREYEDSLWLLIAFLGRYGNQPADVLLQMPTRELVMLSKKVGQLMEEEGKATTSSREE